MRVLMLGWEYPPRVAGGLGAACEGLVRGLRENGVDVVLVLPAGARARTLRRRGGVGSLEIVPAGPRGRRREPSADPYASFPAGRGGGSLYAGDLAGAVQRYAMAAERIAGRRRFDLIHAHDWLTFPAGLAAKQASGRPLIAHVHATELDRSGGLPASSPAFGIERRALPVADRIVAISGYTAGVLRERYGVCADRVRVVHNGIDAPVADAGGPDAVRSSRRAPLVLFVGRVTGQKGPEQFVRAAALVASERPDVRFVVAGAGDRLDAVRAEAAALRLAGRIRFTGFAARAALERLYARADVVVMPSRSEPFGLVALEAAVRGRPVIVSRSAGVTEVLRGALRFDFGDLEELAGKILAILELPRLRDTVAADSEAEARGLSWRAAAARCVAIYRELVAAAPSGGTIAAR